MLSSVESKNIDLKAIFKEQNMNTIQHLVLIIHDRNSDKKHI